VVQIAAYSARTFLTPRNRNWRKPRACLICPNTGSTTDFAGDIAKLPLTEAVLTRLRRLLLQRAWRSSSPSSGPSALALATVR